MTDARGPAANTSTAVDYAALPLGRLVGRYEILGVLGHGGFGITYRARDSKLGREVAIKEYLPATVAVRQDGSSVLPRSTEVVDDFSWGRNRFIEEGRTLANLHEAPSIVKVFDFLEANGTAYIVMELLRGQTLQDLVEADGPLAPATVEAMLWPLLSGLQKVHEAGFLHRDIKPANIMLGAEGRATLIDFGASRAAVADRTGTMTAIFTPGYAAPEQFTSATLGPWTDIYGLGATLYFAVTGKTPPNVVHRLMEDTYEPLIRLRPRGFARNLALGIDAALALAASKRPQTIADWRRLLWQQALSAEPTLVMARPPTAAARPAGAPATAAKWVAAAAAAAVLGTGGYYHYLGTTSVPPLEDSRQTALRTGTEARKETTAAQQLKVDTERQEAEARRRAEADAKARRTAAADAQARRDAEGTATREAENKARRDEEVRARAAQPQSDLDGNYGGALSETITNFGSGRIVTVMVTLRLAGGVLSGHMVSQRCGTQPLSLTVSPSGEIGGAARLPDSMACTLSNGTVVGRVGSQGIQLELRGIGTVVRGTLVKGQQAPTLPAAPSSTVVTATGKFDGVYAGSLSGSTPGGGQAGLRPLRAELRVVQGRLTGEIVHPTCGASPISLPVDASGTIGGTVRLYDPAVGCSLIDATAGGRMASNTATLDLRGANFRVSGSLPRRVD